MRERMFPVDSLEVIDGEIVYGAWANPLMSTILREFGKRAFARSSACMEFESFLKRVLPEERRETCLEIGTYNGITAILLSQYFDKVVCVSVDNDPKQLMKAEIVEFLKIDNIVFHDVGTNEEKKKIIDGLQFDFCYSDGDHTHDTREDFDMVKRCGRVLFHEYWPIQAPVWNLVNSLPQNEVVRADFDCFAFWGKR